MPSSVLQVGVNHTGEQSLPAPGGRVSVAPLEGVMSEVCFTASIRRIYCSQASFPWLCSYSPEAQEHERVLPHWWVPVTSR